MSSQNFRYNTRSNNRTHHGAKNEPTNAVAKKAAREQAIINRIVQQFTSRSRVDIDKWRKAITEAENDRYPKRTLWGDLIKDLDLDAHWSSQILIRRLSVMCKRFKVVDKTSRKELPEKTKQFQAPWFYYLMRTALDAKFFGTQTMEIEDLLQGNKKKDALYKVPIKHIIPESKEILLKSTDNKGYYYGDDPYVLEFQEDVFMGLLSKAAPHIIWKRNAMQSWAEFCEKFGIPMRYVTTNKKDQATLDKLEKMLDQLGSAARAIFPEGTLIDFKEANTQDAYEVFDKMIDRTNSEISKLINAVTMISDSGSSLSQSKVHMEINEKIVHSDCNEFQGLINWNVAPQLKLLGWDFDPEKEEWIWDDTEILSLGALWNIVQGTLKFFEVDEKWIVEKFGIPITGKRTTPLPDNTTSGNIPSNMADFEKMLSEAFSKIMQNANVTFSEAQPTPAKSVEPCFDMAEYSAAIGKHKDVIVDPLMASTVNSLFIKAAEAFFKEPSNKPSTLSDGEWNDLYQYVSEKFFNAVQQGYGIDLSDPDLSSDDEAVLTKLRENVYTFSAFKNFQLLKSLNEILKGEEGKVREWADFKAKALELSNDYNVNWLQTEYNAAIASAQFQARYNEFLAEANDYDVMLQTVGDKRVRDSHQLLDGLVAEVTDEIVLRLATPIDFGCRCEWIQITKGSRRITDPATVKIPERSKGLSNKMGEVFNDEHPYWKGVNNADTTTLRNLVNKTIQKEDDKNANE
jgi:phage gp29-like protein